ncbi:MAG TPA: T9SS type A sorting domain-containing protein, partial [Candidatus Cloacimonetes bacterium]|nr:T9SS type A sorting domain-containing protein [Candidatus Cloacimonadota bacterium]
EDGPEGVVPVVTTIKSIYPNPFNPSTTIAYSLKDKEDVGIYVYNTRGQLVSTIDRGTQDVGHYEYVWHGTNDNGQKLSSGVYFIRLKAGKTIVNKKAVLMK